MKPVLVICFILSAILSYGQNAQTTDRQFPEFSVNTNKDSCTNSNLKGKLVFINFWFSACPPCIAEFDALNKLYEKYSESKNFEFISFTFEDPQEIDRMKKKYNIKYRIFSIPKDECYRLNFNNGFPTSVILDPSGSVKFIHTGGPLDKATINEYFTTTIYPLISKELK